MKCGMRNWAGLAIGLGLMWSAAGCHSSPQASAQGQVDQNPGDPADANLAPVNGNGNSAPAQPAQVLGQNAQYQPQQQGQDYGQQQAAPVEQQAPPGDQSYDNGQPGDQVADPYASDLTDAQASDPPPPLPDYDQPPAQTPTTCGLRATGPGGREGTTGFPVTGLRRRIPARCGLQGTGDSRAGSTASTMDSGGCTSGSMAASTTAMATPVMDTTAATGMGGISTTTRPSTG